MCEPACAGHGAVTGRSPWQSGGDVCRAEPAKAFQLIPESRFRQDHPSHDEYWQSRAVDCSQIKIPAFVIGGWRDIFPEAMPRVYEQLGSAHKKLLMGPFMHS